MIILTTTARPQQRYDHRIRNLVQGTGDVTIATDLGVPRSTGRGWLSKAPMVAAKIGEDVYYRSRELGQRNGAEDSLDCAGPLVNRMADRVPTDWMSRAPVSQDRERSPEAHRHRSGLGVGIGRRRRHAAEIPGHSQ
jgi:hypothetical protein